MNSDMAELSTVATQIEDLVSRITEVAERYHGGDEDAVAVRLFDCLLYTSPSPRDS